MCLDQTKPEFTAMRNAVLRNIGHAFVRMGQYAEAMTVYSQVG